MIFKLLLIVAIIAALAWARKSTPAGNSAGTALNGHAALAITDEPNTISVATFNIQTGKNNQGKRDLMASAKVVKDVDLAGIQEVYAPTALNLMGIGVEQTEVLARRGGFAWLFNATRRRWLREHRGNAILSKLNILRWQVETLPDYSGKSFRNMTIAEVEWRGQTFHFINTHLHTKKGREEQLDIVLREFAKYPRAILVGDFNSRATTPALQQALHDIDITDAIASAGLDIDNPDRIDWILTRGFKVESGEMQPIGVSDHPYYQVNLSYNDQ